MLLEIKSQLTLALLMSVFFEFICSFLYFFIGYCIRINVVLLSVHPTCIQVSGGCPAEFSLNGASIINIISIFILRTLTFIIFGPLSSAQLNPSVTFTVMILGLVSVLKGVLYIIVQSFSSVLAAALAPLLFLPSLKGPNSSFDDLADVILVTPILGSSGISVFVSMLFYTGVYIFFILMILLNPASCVYAAEKSMRQSIGVPLMLNVIKDDQSVFKNSIKNLRGKLPGARLSEDSLLGGDEIWSVYASSTRSSRLHPMDWHQLYHKAFLLNMNIFKLMSSISLGLIYSLALIIDDVNAGLAFNPARAFGPALVTGDWMFQWAYWSGGVVGSLIGIAAFLLNMEARTMSLK